MDIVILLFLVFLNGLFVMSEIALVSARKPRLESQAEKGDRKAKQALDLSNNPEIFLSATKNPSHSVYLAAKNKLTSTESDVPKARRLYHIIEKSNRMIPKINRVYPMIFSFFGSFGIRVHSINS